LEIYPVNNKFFPEIYEALNSPVIIHYTGRIKPWHKDCSTPYKKIWLFVKSQTVWKNKKLKHSDPKIIISSIFQLLKNIILVLFGRNVFDKSKGTLLHLFGRSVFEKLNVICKKSDIADSDYITNIEEIMKKISRYAYKDSEKERDLHGNTN
jgi:lipopolysaccharide biosynthesis glycosyltransferase